MVTLWSMLLKTVKKKNMMTIIGYRPTAKSIFIANSSGVATVGERGGREPPLTAKNLPKIRKKREKSGKKRKNREEKAKIGKVFFTLPLLTDRAGYATGQLPGHDSFSQITYSVVHWRCSNFLRQLCNLAVIVGACWPVHLFCASGYML